MHAECGTIEGRAVQLPLFTKGEQAVAKVFSQNERGRCEYLL